MDNDDLTAGRTTLCRWIIRVIFLLFQISPLLRYLDTLIYGIKSVVAPDNLKGLFSRRMLDEDTNGALLRLFHCFLHSAPQALLQLVILLKHVQSGNGTVKTQNVTTAGGTTSITTNTTSATQTGKETIFNKRC